MLFIFKKKKIHTCFSLLLIKYYQKPKLTKKKLIKQWHVCLDQDLRLISTLRSNIWNSEYMCPYRNMEFGKKFEKSKKMKNENSQKQISSFFL